jgi:hypothetical protein
MSDEPDEDPGEDLLPQVFIGNAKTPLADVVPVTPDEDEDPDDTVIETPQYLIDALGFDPATDPEFIAASTEKTGE